MRAPRQGRPLAVALTAAFALGAALGAYGWSVRDSIAATPEINLIAGPIAMQVAGEVPATDGTYRISANVFNLADNDVTVRGASLAGWTVTEGPSPTVVRAGEWTSIPFTAILDCHDPGLGSEPGDLELHLRLDSEGKSEDLTLPVRGSSADADVLSYQLCLEDESLVHLLLDDMELAADDGTLEMRIPVLAAGREGEPVTLADLVAATPTVLTTAFRTEAPGLPLRLRPGDTRTVTMRWTVDDCASAEEIGEVQIGTQTDGTSQIFYQLPGQAVAALARLAVAECSS